MCLCMCVCAVYGMFHAMEHVWRSDGNLGDSVFFHMVGPWLQTLVARLGSKRLYPLSHVTGLAILAVLFAGLSRAQTQLAITSHKGPLRANASPQELRHRSSRSSWHEAPCLLPPSRGRDAVLLYKGQQCLQQHGQNRALGECTRAAGGCDMEAS